MKPACRFSAWAEVDVEGIALFIAADNPRRALSFVEELRARCEALAHHPIPVHCARNTALVFAWPCRDGI